MLRPDRVVINNHTLWYIRPDMEQPLNHDFFVFKGLPYLRKVYDIESFISILYGEQSQLL
ncbi:hypothetical protein ACVBE9_06390 [Eionea flava]